MIISITCEVDSDELSKPRRVVVSCGLGVAIRLENWVGRHDLVLEGDFLLNLLPACAGSCQGKVGDHLERQIQRQTQTRPTRTRSMIFFLPSLCSRSFRLQIRQ